MKEIYAVINQKGGVGKSTTAQALGFGLCAAGMRVLCVDLDAQGNLSYTLGADESLSTVMDVLEGAPVTDAIQKSAGKPDLIAASPRLAGADLVLNQTGKEYRLREALSTVLSSYDYIVMDTPPALGVLTINALTCATGAIIPAQADIYSLQGIGQLYGTLSAVRRYTNPGLRILGILITRYSGRSILSRDITETMEQTAKELDTIVFETKIRESVAVKEAQAQKRSIFEYAPTGNAALDYAQFMYQLLGRKG